MNWCHTKYWFATARKTNSLLLPEKLVQFTSKFLVPIVRESPERGKRKRVRARERDSVSVSGGGQSYTKDYQVSCMQRALSLPKTSCWKSRCALYVRKYGNSNFCHLRFCQVQAKVNMHVIHRERNNEQAGFPKPLLLSYLVQGKVFFFFHSAFLKQGGYHIWGTPYARKSSILLNRNSSR